MPVIPEFQNELSVPTAPAPPHEDMEAAQAPGQAMAQAAGAVSAQAGQWAAQYAEARRQSVAANLVASGYQQLGDLAFQQSKIADHIQAAQGFQQGAQTIQQQLLAKVSDPEVAGYVQNQLGQHAVALGLETQRQSFALESNQARANVDQNNLQFAQGAATAATPELRAQFVDQATAGINGAVAAGWMTPEDGQQRRAQFTSMVAEVGAKQMILQNPAAAAQILGDPAQVQKMFPGLLPNVAENLASRAENRAYREEARADREQTHVDMMATRNLVQSQGANAALLIGNVLKNPDQTIDPVQLAGLVEHRQLSEAGFNAVLTAQRGAQEGRDTPAVVFDLHSKLNAGTLEPDDVANALTSHAIKTTTAATFMSSIGAQAKGQFTQQRADGLKTVDDAMGGGAIDKGLVDLTNDAAKGMVARRAMAMMEFSNRVDVNKENPLAVASDIVRRYGNPPATLLGLEPPRAGAIRTPADIPAVVAATQDMLTRGLITPQQYDDQRTLIGRYQRLMQRPIPAPKNGAGAAGPAAGLSPAGSE